MNTLEWCSNLSRSAVVIISSPIISDQTENDLLEVIIIDCFSYISLIRLKNRLASLFSMGGIADLVNDQDLGAEDTVQSKT